MQQVLSFFVLIFRKAEEDEERALEDKIQKATDSSIAKIDEMAQKKEKEIMSV